MLEQSRFEPLTAPEQIAVFMATNAGLFDGLTTEENKEAQKIVREVLQTQFSAKVTDILARKKLAAETQEKMLLAFKAALQREGIKSDDD